MEKIKVATGITWLSIPEVNLHILCGCPMNSVKHLMRHGLIRKVFQDSVAFESGPNVSEFPVLHMMYRQGIVIPGHPGNNEKKPMLIGVQDQITAQSQYIFCGTYGLTTLDELMDAGISHGEAVKCFV